MSDVGFGMSAVHRRNPKSEMTNRPLSILRHKADNSENLSLITTKLITYDMGMTITEKIMARNSGREKTVPGELVWVDVHTVMTMDYLGKQTFNQLHKLGVTEVFDKNRVICVSDHLIPPPTEQFATMLNQWREVVREHDIKNFYDLGRQGIAHQIMVEQGHVLPGKISIGTDSLTRIRMGRSVQLVMQSALRMRLSQWQRAKRGFVYPNPLNLLCLVSGNRG